MATLNTPGLRMARTYKNAKGHILDNRNVVPYNPFCLSGTYDFHINIEICS